MCYVVGSAPAEQLRSYLRSKLPAYMVPAVWHSLAALPLSANGKIDRKALPLSLDAAQAKVLPRNPMEQKLVSLWEEILEAPVRNSR